MTTYRFGGNQFTNCSVPLAFAGRYFIVEPGERTLLVSVVVDQGGQPTFEILKNEPGTGPGRVTKTGAGIITVSDADTGRFRYKVRPGNETSIVFGTVDGAEGVEAKVTDRRIQVGGTTLENNVFSGVGAGVVVSENGNVGIGGPIPEKLHEWFAGRA